MAEWLYEAGIGETRAARVADGRIVEARIETDIPALRLGAVLPMKLVEAQPGGGVMQADGLEAMLDRVPAGVSVGRTLTVRVTREALPEAGRPKRARVVVTEDAVRPAPTLLEEISASGLPVRHAAAHEPDALEAAGWSELLDEAMTGEIVFAGGALRMSPTPAMTLFDVDGAGDLEALSVAAARAVALTIRRMAIGGSIGVDFPTIEGKAARQRVAEAIDATLPPPFERTAVNGFGFLQIVRPRPRASLPELLRADPVGAAARAALRMLERVPVGAPNAHRLPAEVLARIDARADWRAELVRRTGRDPILSA